jgi:DNA-directed RNA polymerase subunit K/omega
MPGFSLVGLLLASSVLTPQVSSRTVDPRTGSTTLMLGTLSNPLQGELRPAVRKYALDVRSELGVPLESTLGEPEVFGTRFGASFHLPQLLDGVQIYKARVVVTLDATRRVKQLTSSAFRFEKVAREWKLTQAQAIEIATGKIPFARLGDDAKPVGEVARHFFAVGSEARAGYLVHVPSVDRLHNGFVGIDAATGEVLLQENRVFFAAPNAQVYSSSPGNPGVGRTSTTPVQLVHPDGRQMVLPLTENPTRKLNGTQLTAFNCCPNEGCSTAPGATYKTATGNLNMSGFPIKYTIAECDRVQRATDDNASASWVYPPLDPPARGAGGRPGPVAQSEPADSDHFSEVHAFFHVNAVFDWVRALSTASAPLFAGENIPPFQMRDEKRNPRRTPAVWTNVILPDLNELQSNLNPQTMSTETKKLMRMDNAAFVPYGMGMGIPLGDYQLDIDTLMIFQGEGADFAYDAPVLWHEFGHGVIFATANFNSFTIDSWSGNNEGAALHEGLADYMAAAFGNNPLVGEYVAPRLSTGGAPISQGNALRTAANDYSCPSVLWGESHQDGMHITGALWEARARLFQSNDQGKTFDAVFYAALASMTPATDFAQMAAILTAHAVAAFPQVPNAKAQLEALFDSRGVTKCSKVLDVTSDKKPRFYYGLGGTQQAGLNNGQLVPGPYQFKVKVPGGAKSVTVTALTQGSPFGGAPAVKLLAKAGAPIKFTRTERNLAHDATATGNATLSGNDFAVTADIAVPCGESSELYFTLGSAGAQGIALQQIQTAVTVADKCAPAQPVDAGTPEQPVVDAGTTGPGQQGPGQQGPGEQPGQNTDPDQKTGCGCNAGGVSGLAAMALLAAIARRRRGL